MKGSARKDSALFIYFKGKSSPCQICFGYAFVGASAPRRNMKDEGRPLEAGLQEQALNHLKLHWSRAIVVSVKEKAAHDLVR